MSNSIPSASVYTDIQGLQSLRNAAEKNSPEALKEVAKQFEALFIQNLLKNMRATKLDDGLLGSDQGDMYLDMFDKQLSLTLTREKGVGIADMLYEQLKYTLDEAAPVAENATKKYTEIGEYQHNYNPNSNSSSNSSLNSKNSKSDDAIYVDK